MRGLLTFTALLMVGIPGMASACGGFFCNAATQVPIVQAGEQVIFARHEGKTIMHIQVTYSGAPTSFGWLVPLAQVPEAVDGTVVPLEQILRLSHPRVFTELERDTRPSFTVTGSLADTTCRDQISGPDRVSFGCSASRAEAAPMAGMFDASPSAQMSDREDPVQVLDTSSIGPYAAELVTSTDADALYEWLEKNGYQQDPAARPILEHYVASGFKFLGLKLQSGMNVGDLRPLALTLSEDAPCVPLRLTAIAATEDMPITIYILGQHRAIPKNALHAVVNPRAISWPGGTNYDQVVSQAVDEAEGRAFVTQHAGPTQPFRGRFGVTADWLAPLLDKSLSGEQVLDDIGQRSIAGQPIQTDPVFQSIQAWWMQTGDDELLRYRLAEEIVEPLAQLGMLMDETEVITRLYTRIDPESMDRDPLFSFNPDLPMVPSAQAATAVVHGCDQEYLEVTYPDGSIHATTCQGGCMAGPWGAIIPPVADAPALLVAEVFEESGPPRTVHSEDIYLADDVLAMSIPGAPSVPDDMTLRTAEERPMRTGVEIPVSGARDGDDDDSGCIASANARRGAGALIVTTMLGLGLLLLRRREPTGEPG